MNTVRLVSISTPRGVEQAFILIKPDHPVASVVLFAGSAGALGLRSSSSLEGGAEDFGMAGNFLVHSREKFASHDLMVAVVDARGRELRVQHLGSVRRALDHPS